MAFSDGVMRSASTGAVHESRAQSSWLIHWNDQPGTMGLEPEWCEAE